MRRPLAVIAVLLMAAVQPASAAEQDKTTASTAVNYAYPLNETDPKGDHQGVSGAPNALNPENDLTYFGATDDAESLILRLHVDTLAFAVPQGTALLTVEFKTAKGGDFETSVVYKNGGEAPTVTDYDPVQGGGDPDVVPTGTRVEILTASKAIFVFVPHAGTKLELGDKVTIDAISSGRGMEAEAPSVGSPGVSQPDRDIIELSNNTYTIMRGASPTGPNATGNRTEPPKQDTPGLPLVAALGAVAMAAAVWERRRRST